MASDILHIKDSYYFEVPKALWKPHYESLEDVPFFLRKLHHEDFHLHGKDYTEAGPRRGRTRPARVQHPNGREDFDSPALRHAKVPL